MAFELTFVGIKDAIQNGLKTVEVLGFEFLMLSVFFSQFVRLRVNAQPVVYLAFWNR